MIERFYRKYRENTRSFIQTISRVVKELGEDGNCLRKIEINMKKETKIEII